MRSFAVLKALCHPNSLSKTVEDGSCSVKSRSEPLRWSLTGRLMVTLGISGMLPRRDVAQPGRALAWGARGRQFKSARPDECSPFVSLLFQFSDWFRRRLLFCQL